PGRRGQPIMTILRLSPGRADAIPVRRFLVPPALILLALGGFLPATSASVDGPKTTAVIGSLLPAEGGPAAKPSPLKAPFGVDFDSGNSMFIVELEGGRVHQFWPDGKLKVIAGDGSKGYTGDGGPADKATFNGMHNVAVAANDDIYIADSWN